jgi:hypothetical protein
MAKGSGEPDTVPATTSWRYPGIVALNEIRGHVGWSRRRLCGVAEPQQGHVVEVRVPVAAHPRVLDLDEHHLGEEEDTGVEEVARVADCAALLKSY